MLRNREAIRDRIFRHIKRMKLTQADFAERSGVPESTLSDIKNGKRDVTAEVGEKIAAAMGTTWDDLLDTPVGPEPAATRHPEDMSPEEWQLIGVARLVGVGRVLELARGLLAPAAGQGAANGAGGTPLDVPPGVRTRGDRELPRRGRKKG
jgi:transcriptional regulator with XRE-family HTH domain